MISRDRKNCEMGLNYLIILTKRRKQSITKILLYCLMTRITKKTRISKLTETSCCPIYKVIKKHFFKKMMKLIGMLSIPMKLTRNSYLKSKKIKKRTKNLRLILHQVFKKILARNYWNQKKKKKKKPKWVNLKYINRKKEIKN